jgi:hypothetical protein
MPCLSAPISPPAIRCPRCKIAARLARAIPGSSRRRVALRQLERRLEEIAPGCRKRASIMSNASGGRRCRTRSHWSNSLGIYESLPREVRDKLKIAKGNVCAGCIRAKLKRYGLEQTLRDLDSARRIEKEKR